MERLDWIEIKRKHGNELFSQNDNTKAIDEYMKCLCALDFKSCSGSIPSDEKIKEAEKGVKVPVLNNMALCLQKQGHLDKAINMCDQVLEID